MNRNGLASLIDTALSPKPVNVPFWEQAPSPKAPAVLTPQQAQAAKLMDEAMVLLKFRQFQAAVDPITRASRLWPTNAEIHFHLGGVLLEVGRPDLALAEFDKALGLRPQWSDAHNNRSAALARMGQTEEAIKAAERAVATGKNPSALANLCAAYSSQGDNEKALACGEQAIKLSQGTNAMALVNYGVALRGAWRLDEAAGAQQRAIDLVGGQDHMAWSNLGAIRNLQGRNHEAMAVTQRAAELCRRSRRCGPT